MSNDAGETDLVFDWPDATEVHENDDDSDNESGHWGPVNPPTNIITTSRMSCDRQLRSVDTVPLSTERSCRKPPCQLNRSMQHYLIS
jgi:hypothetical protein